jgi:hypothetical protein
MRQSVKPNRLDAASRAAVAFVVVCGVAFSPAFARKTVTGRITGAIVTSSSQTYPADILGIRENVRIVARTIAGVSVGTFRLGAPGPVTLGQVRVPYTIDGVPVGVAVHVFAERYVAAAPSPEPSGFYMSFNTHKTGGDPSVPFYPVTLDAAHPRAEGIDFSYEPIEVPPMLPPPPGTPAPAATATATP